MVLIRLCLIKLPCNFDGIVTKFFICRKGHYGVWTLENLASYHGLSYHLLLVAQPNISQRMWYAVDLINGRKVLYVLTR